MTSIYDNVRVLHEAEVAIGVRLLVLTTLNRPVHVKAGDPNDAPVTMLAIESRNGNPYFYVRLDGAQLDELHRAFGDAIEARRNGVIQ